MALSNNTYQSQDTTDPTEAQVFLSNWQNPNISGNSSDPDQFLLFKFIIDKVWTTVTFWLLNSTASDFTVDITLSYIANLGDGDNWDQVPTVGTTTTVNLATVGDKFAHPVPFSISGLQQGKLLLIRWIIGNWSLAGNRSIRSGPTVLS